MHIKEMSCPHCSLPLYGKNAEHYPIRCPKCDSMYTSGKANVDFNCSSCGTRIVLRRCVGCGKYLPISEYHKTAQECKLCAKNRLKVWAFENKEDNHLRNKRGIEKMNDKAEARYEVLKEKLALVYKTPMTELEWAETCKYFGGCALCGDPHIEARIFFVPVTDGGNYSRFNMFPVCGTCDLSRKQLANPFKYFQRGLFHRLHYTINRERFDRLSSYLIDQIEKELANAKQNPSI